MASLTRAWHYPSLPTPGSEAHRQPWQGEGNALLQGPEVLSVKELSREGRIENEGSQESVLLRLRLKSLAPAHEH